MEWKDYFNNVLKGVVGAIAVVTVLTAILSLVMSFVDISSGMFSAIYVVITSISLLFGTIFVLFGAEATLGLYDLMKFSLCVVVGILSGMLGINLGSD